MRIIGSICALLLSSAVAATSLSSIVVFGDSLSDNGNFYEFSEHQFPTSPPYFQGRFSNGPIWVEHLIASYFPESSALHLEDYAFGGAAVSLNEDEKQISLQQEISHYLQDHQQIAKEDSLFVIWIGGNNYLGKIDDPDQLVNNVNAGIVQSLKKLVDKGAKHIMVISLPDLGKAPIAVNMQAEDALAYVSAGHNNALARSVEELQQSIPDVQWIFYDVNAAFTEIRANPAQFGYENVSQSCLDVAKDSDCNTFFFFDSVHPTAYTHKLLGQGARLLLDQTGVAFH